MSYCISVWGGVAPAKLDSLFVAQKRCIRILYGDKDRFLEKFMTCARCRPFDQKQNLMADLYVKEHTKPLFKKHKIMTVHNIYTYHCFNELLKILKFRLPMSLYSLFSLSSRKSTLLLTTTPTIHFIYKSSTLWNHLRNKLEILDFSVNINTTKTKLKSLILSNQTAYDSTEWVDHNYSILNC